MASDPAAGDRVPGPPASTNGLTSTTSIQPQPPTAPSVASILGTGSEEAFDRLTRLATLALRAPLAVISLITDGRLLLKSAVGLPEPWASDRDVPLPHAIFRHAVATSKPFIVENTSRHPLTRDMLLGEEWSNAAYCGIPLVLPGRRVIGVLSVMDRKPRSWTPREISFLQDLGASAAEAIQERLQPTARVQPVATPAPEVQPATDALIVMDRAGLVTAVNAKAESVLRRPAKELTGRRLADSFPSLEGSVFQQHWNRALEGTAEAELEQWCETLGVWLESRAFPVEEGLRIQLRDVTARRDAEEALRQSEARYRSVFQESKDPIFFASPDGTLVECNRAALELLGHSRDELFRQRFEDLVADSEARDELRKKLQQEGMVEEFEAQLRTKSGERLDARIGISSRTSAAGEHAGYRVTVRDNTERKQLAKQLLQSAFHDPLTGLANRAVFIDRLDRLFMQAQRRAGYRFAVLFIDLDRFKLINDTFGHIAGDEMLATVARRLEACLRQEDSVARFGGDEFAILLDGVTDVRDATRIADRVNNELGLPIRIGSREVAASASIGIAVSAQTHERAEQVLSDADVAMYRSKAGGGARYEVFDTAMHTRALEQLRLESDLQRAVREKEFLVHYQPILSVEGGSIAGFEALLRWRHPGRGLLQPGEFIELADQTGLISEIGWFVVDRVCTQVREWRDVAEAATLSLGVSINLSPRQFNHPDLLRRIDESLAKTGLTGDFLRVEITEDTLMEDADAGEEVLEGLKQRSIAVSVDSFGTGFSSLRYLQRLSIATLKIDRSFLRGIDRDPYNRGVVESIIALGRSMGIDVIAQGVETLEQFAELRLLGAGFAQGYLFAEPLDPDSATDLVLERLRDVT
jgi:diguanylate cyclase (GGDEF)-like protein/PAS domain S-box-containing protein